MSENSNTHFDDDFQFEKLKEDDNVSMTSNMSFSSMPETLNNRIIFFDHAIAHADEYILYRMLLNKTKSNIQHDLYPYQYHCCEFVVETLRRFFTVTLRVEYLIPVQILIAFIRCVNEHNYDMTDFCNFMCDGDMSGVRSSHELIVPREIYKILSGDSVIQKYICESTMTDVIARTEIFKFINGLSKNSKIVTDRSLRYILYYVGKIFKHRKTIITANDQIRVRHYLYKCLRLSNSSQYTDYMWDT